MNSNQTDSDIVRCTSV